MFDVLCVEYTDVHVAQCKIQKFSCSFTSTCLRYMTDAKEKGYVVDNSLNLLKEVFVSHLLGAVISSW